MLAKPAVEKNWYSKNGDFLSFSKDFPKICHVPLNCHNFKLRIFPQNVSWDPYLSAKLTGKNGKLPCFPQHSTKESMHFHKPTPLSQRVLGIPDRAARTVSGGWTSHSWLEIIVSHRSIGHTSVNKHPLTR